MRARLTANISLHAVAGLCCFFPFWLINYGVYDQNWSGPFEMNAWMPVLKIGFGCAIAAFVISFLGSRFICSQGSKWIPAMAFALAFALISLSPVASWGDEDGQWKLSVVGVPITLAISICSYWGSSFGARQRHNRIKKKAEQTKAFEDR